jgi:cyclophilin family peptidyl-prolyl cis-trans isomerase
MLLAGDLGLDTFADDLSLPLEPHIPAVASAQTFDAPAEGEETPEADLVAFAKALADAGVKLYGAAWCGACTTQKELFEDGGDFLPFIEVTNPDRTQNQTGIDAGITAYPTWDFGDGVNEVGVFSLEAISQRSGVAIPTSTQPFVAPLPDRVLFAGSPLHVALNGYDPNGSELTYTVESNNPLVTPTVLEGNRSASIYFASWGEIVVHLFEGRAPDATGRFIELAEAGFYDAANNSPPIGVHRAIDNFVMQFGDPLGNGTGGSSLPDFDDDFHPELQHNDKGIISWAKSADDTNNSQVFLTDTATRWLDFNHSVFGTVTEGDKVRDDITATATDGSNQPLYSIPLASVTVFDDVENGVVMLAADESITQPTDVEITVTAEDVDGNQYVETFTVSVQPDPYDGGPFLTDLPDVITTTVGEPVVLQLDSIDVENDTVVYDGVRVGSVNYTVTVNNQNGLAVVTPPAGFVGSFEVLFRVSQLSDPDTDDQYDSQYVTIEVTPEAPTSIDLLEASDSGISVTDEITNDSTPSLEISGVVDGATVTLYDGETVVGEADATGSTVVITASTLTDGSYNLVAKQTLDGTESPASDPLQIVIDTVAPPPFISTPPTIAAVGQEYRYDAENDGADSLAYSLVNPPNGAAIDAVSGIVSWTPSGSQVGPHLFTLVASDVAGNTRDQDLDIAVSTDAKVSLRLELTDDQDNVLNTVDVGDTFQLNVYAQDLRQLPEGVFAAFLDILFDAQLVQVDGTISYGSTFPNSPSGETGTPGLIDELGGVASSATYGGEEVLLATIPMRAQQSGDVTFTGEEADDVPANYVLLHGENTFVPAERIIYGTTSLTVDISFGAVADSYNVAEDSDETTLDVLDNDEVFPGSTGELTITDVDDATNGTVTIASDGKSLIYKPNADFFGQEQFIYYVSDGTGTDQAQVTVDVSARNDDPQGVDDQYTIQEDDTDVVLDVLDNDVIAPDVGETLKITDVSAPSEGGFVDLPSDGSQLVYTPKANFFGTETFTYTFSDGNGGTSTATVEVTVVETNDPPQATNDLENIDEDSGFITIDVLQNDNTAGDEDETLTITEVSSPEFGGSVEIADDRLTLRYSPPADFFGVERFTYTISDGNGGTAQATVSMVVGPVNDPPTATADEFDVVKDTAATVLAVLDNDSIAPDEGETLTVDSVSDDAQGIVTISSDGQSVLYTPPSGFTGTDSFSYDVRDSSGSVSTASVTVNVLEYIPSSLSGYVFLDVDNDGSRDPNDSALGGVIVTLTGTNVLGEQVDLQQVTNALGFYEFANLAPGSYTLTETQPEFLLDGVDSIGTQGGTAGNDRFDIELEQDTVGEENNFGERGREAQRISLSDFLSTTPRDSVFIASDENSGATKWYAIEREWTPAYELSAEIKEDTVQLDVENGASETQRGSLDYSDIAAVRKMPGENGTLLTRVVAAADDFMIPDGDGSSAEGEADAASVESGAEGEADTPAARLAAATLALDPIAVGNVEPLDLNASTPLLTGPIDTATPGETPAEGEADPMRRALETVDNAVVEVGFDDSHDPTADVLARAMQEDEGDYAAAADDLFSDLAVTDEPE